MVSKMADDDILKIQDIMKLGIHTFLTHLVYLKSKKTNK
jgi:hypothetical protein